jgi:hypothetical protein
MVRSYGSSVISWAKAPALFAAQHVRERHVGVVEEQLAGVLALLPDLFEDAADAEARVVPTSFEQHQRDALGAAAGSVLATTRIRSAR